MEKKKETTISWNSDEVGGFGDPAGAQNDTPVQLTGTKRNVSRKLDNDTSHDSFS